MTNTIKTAVAALALVATPALVSAQSLAVSLSATFNNNVINNSGELNVANETVEVMSPTSLSVAAATGTYAAASTAGVTVSTTANATFANSGGGEVSSSEQTGSFMNDEYTATVSFGDDGT